MLPTISNRLQLDMMDALGYLIIGGVSVPLLWEQFSAHHSGRWLTVGLLLAFLGMTFVRDHALCHLGPWSCHLYLAVQTVIIAILALGSTSSFAPVILFFMLSAEATMEASQRAAFIWVAIFTVVTGLALYAQSAEALVALPIYIGGYFFFAAFAMQTARAEAAREESQRLLQELQVTHRQLQEYAAQAEQLAVSQERNRLAREMHDTLGHRLTVSAVQLEAAQRLVHSDPDRAAHMVGTVREQVRAALGELRRTVATLRAPLEADLALPSALQHLASGFEQATGITVHLDLPQALPDLPGSHRLALYRAAQEGLTNVQKHAETQEAWLHLQQRDGDITLIVEDNGIGLPANPDREGFGLRGLQERAAQLGGEMQITTRTQGGARLRMSLPLPAEQQHD